MGAGGATSFLFHSFQVADEDSTKGRLYRYAGILTKLDRTKIVTFLLGFPCNYQQNACLAYPDTLAFVSMSVWSLPCTHCICYHYHAADIIAANFEISKLNFFQGTHRA